MKRPNSAQLTLRMSPQLRDALRASAQEAGCSLNQFAIQVLAAAAGHRARFRGTAETGPTREETRMDLREMPRNTSGFPLDYKARAAHLQARQRYQDMLYRQMEPSEAGATINRIDLSEPWFYVERELDSG